MRSSSSAGTGSPTESSWSARPGSPRMNETQSILENLVRGGEPLARHLHAIERGLLHCDAQLDAPPDQSGKVGLAAPVDLAVEDVAGHRDTLGEAGAADVFRLEAVILRHLGVVVRQGHTDLAADVGVDADTQVAAFQRKGGKGKLERVVGVEALEAV